MTVTAITSKAQFDQIVNSGKTVYVDFYADWCGPCRQISPHFGKLASEHTNGGTVEFYQVNIDNVQEVAAELAISSIPTFHAYKGGRRVDQLVGANPSSLTSLVQRQL